MALVFGKNSLSGGFLYSFVGLICGLGIPMIVGYSYEKIKHVEALGGGTVKLLAMVGSWVGLKIFSILGVFLLLL